MAENIMLEATDVRRSEASANKVTVLILAKDAEGNTYTIPFMLKAHYMEGVQKTFSRLSPINLSKAADKAEVETEAEAKEEAKDE